VCPYWRVEEEHQLIDLIDSGTSLKEIAEQLHRSVDAVVLKAKRLGLEIPGKCRVKNRDIKVTKSEATTTTSTETLSALKPAAELISMEEMMKTMLGALEKLQNPTVLSPLEIKRCRTIVSVARTYMHMLEKFEKWTSIEQRMVDMEARILEIHKQTLQKTQDPQEKARLEEEIKSLEQSLQLNAKYYKPFERKPSLMSPF
jgi:hypothetical protein